MKKSKKKVKRSLKECLLRRWRNSSLRVRELCRMEFGEITISKEEATATLKTLDEMAQAVIDRTSLAATRSVVPFGGQAQANIYPLGHTCQCSVCHPRLGRTGIGGIFGWLY